MTRHLPVLFNALDIEGKTKAVPVLVCPVRGDVMTVGSCGRCHEFRRIEFDEHGQPQVSCGLSRRQKRTAAPLCVQSALRVPSLSTAPSTTLQTVLRHAMLVMPHEPIPVLDWDSSPLGFVTTAELERLVRAGVPATATTSEVMCRQIVCVPPETDAADAWLLFADTDAPQLFVVSADGSFLGLVAPCDLSRMPSHPN